jgi:hypothetical protein
MSSARFPRLTLAEASGLPSAVDDIYAQRLLGVVVSGVFEARELEQPLGRVLDAARASLGDGPAAVGVQILGCMLAPTAEQPLGPELEPYLAQAAEGRASRFFDDDARFAERVGQVVEALAGGRQLQLPHFEARPYADATIRIVPPGASVALHCDTYRPAPVFAHIDQLTSRETRLSWYLTLASPEAGGELVIYLTPRGELGAKADVRETPQLRITNQPGDLLLFDAGRHFHEVLSIRGARPRVTLGGFAGIARDAQVLYAWG